MDVDEWDFERVIRFPMNFGNREFSGLKNYSLADTRDRRPLTVDGLIGTKVEIDVDHDCITVSSIFRTDQTSVANP